MKSIVSVHLVSGATTKVMKCHLIGCLENESPDTIFLHHGTNDLRSEEWAENIASNVVNVTLSLLKMKKKTLFMFQDCQ